MQKYSVKLLYQFRIESKFTQKMRVCDEKILLFNIKNDDDIIEFSIKEAKKQEFNYINDDNDPVFYEYIGILDICQLGIETKKNEVWYDIKTMLLPMERKDKILPTKEQLKKRLYFEPEEVLLEELNHNLSINSKDVFQSLGELHDCEIKDFTFSKTKSILKIFIDDLYSNFIELAEYKDLKNIYLNFKVKSYIEIDIDTINQNNITIYNIEFKDEFTVINLSPSGRIKLDYEKVYLSSE